jgi:hypothetical protein
MAGRRRYLALPFLHNHAAGEHLDITCLSPGESNPDIGIFKDNPVFYITDLELYFGVYSYHPVGLAYLDSRSDCKSGYFTNVNRSGSTCNDYFLLLHNHFYRIYIYSAASCG